MKPAKDTKFMQSVTRSSNNKPQMDKWSKEPAMQSSFKKKHVPLCNDKSCQSTRCYKKKIPRKQGSMCSDKICQEIPNVQMQPKKPVKESSHMKRIHV